MDAQLQAKFFHAIDGRVEQLNSHLVNGYAQDFSDYKSVVGEIRGLIRAKEEFREAINALRNAEEEEE